MFKAFGANLSGFNALFSCSPAGRVASRTNVPHQLLSRDVTKARPQENVAQSEQPDVTEQLHDVTDQLHSDAPESDHAGTDHLGGPVQTVM